MALCISCAKFSLKPREADGSNEELRQTDRRMLALGLGRCKPYFANNVWFPAEYERECAGHTAISADQIENRRALLKERQDAVRDTHGI